MEAVAVVNEGMEEIAALEVKELTGVKPRIEKGCVVFRPKGLLDICKVCYMAHSVCRAFYLLGEFNAGDISHLSGLAKKKEIAEWSIGCKTFVVECKRIGSHPYTSADVQSRLGAEIKKLNSMDCDFRKQDIIFFVYINGNKGWFGVDFAGVELDKRDYKIFNNPRSLKGPIAYAMIRGSGFSEGKVLLDPFCGGAEIPIEAALSSSGLSLHYYSKDKFCFLRICKLADVDFDSVFDGWDSQGKKFEAKISGFDSLMRNIIAARKNAKIAGVQKQIIFSRVDTEWLDTKLDKASLDMIVTNPPMFSSRDLSRTGKLYDELFYQAGFLLKEKGIIVMHTNNPAEAGLRAGRRGFSLMKKRGISSGKETFQILTFRRKKPKNL